LLAGWSAPPQDLGVRFSFIDLDSLKVLRVGLAVHSISAPTLSRSGGCFLTYGVGKAGDLRLCASAGGTLFGLWAANDPMVHEPMVLLADGNTVRGIRQQHTVSYLIPGADGTTVFTTRMGIINNPRSPRDDFSRTYVPPEQPIFPSPDPAYSLSLRGGGSISVRLTRDNAPLLIITGLDEMVGVTGRDQGLVNDRISVEKRFHLVPAAKLLVTIPTSNDRLVLRRLDIGESLARLPVDFLVVTSPPVLAAKAGQFLQYRIGVLSRHGRITWTLDHGPEGLSVSSDGVVSWRVPHGLEGSEETATVTIGDASGRKVTHRITIRVE
jgi:hypothetical protein